jgi:hypothetical protein
VVALCPGPHRGHSLLFTSDKGVSVNLAILDFAGLPPWHPPARACMLSASAPMLAYPRFGRPCVLPIAGAVLSTLLTLACLIDTQGLSPERRPIEPVNRVLRGGGPFTGLALRRAR